MLLAVSGGPDSTALMHAAASLRPRSLFVATVDHGLRLEAADEARQVGRAADALGLPHVTLRWEGVPAKSAIQAEARAARYRLLAAHAVSVGAKIVLTGHTRDDQAETVLMRLIAGSGPAGLAGMRPERPLAEGIVLGRPFLALPKADLVAWCEARNLDFVRDPSNADDRYGRVRLRRLLPLLAGEGLTTDRLVTLAARAARDDAALADAADLALDAAMRRIAGADGETARLPSPSAGESGPRAKSGEGCDDAGTGAPLSRPSLTRGPASPAGGGGGAMGSLAAAEIRHLHGPMIAALPDAVALRVLDRALDQAGGALPRRLGRLERLVLDDLLPALRAGRPVRRTLRGLVVTADSAGRVTIQAAPPRRPAGLAAGPLDLLGKGEPSAYIDPERADGPAASGTRSARSRD